ncbi:uncharacterized protein KGF55_005630 [Candida pseudojiufengensis]|uniref:uncharacterized protein n=1 Tax=Candida pseudojiufengensis TaxID=497109 RepID=UPI0022243EB8|nr:uncharacterized protein KGF55_005630 [Candida pseudojiufengensis]KAI5958976.1 hypothetical protein KGF55_005630 [Candida pseudojiufengensis]
MEAIRSRTETHLHNIMSNRSEVRSIDPKRNAGDEELLNQIGYKQELRRHYSTFETFGISFSIMSLLPSIASILPVLLESGLGGAWWSWFAASCMITLVGCSMSFLGSALPTSGGLYYYANYYSPDSIRVPISFLIGWANTLGLLGGYCSISWGFAVEVLSAVNISMDGNFDVTNARCYGIYAATIISTVIIACLTTKNAARLQGIAVYVNVFLVLLFVIAVPVGYSRNHTFNTRGQIFGDFTNSRSWSTGWSVCLSLQGAVWVIGSFDSVIHCSEECKDPQRAIGFGIVGSIVACAILGIGVVSVCCACIIDGDISRVLESETGSAMAQIIDDALGRKWATAFMALISVGQYMMAVSIVLAISRQVFASSRDSLIPVVSNYLKYINPKYKIPVRSTCFCGIMALILGLLSLIGPAGANALFSLAINSNSVAWGTPMLLVLLPYGRKKFIPGPFWFGKTISYSIMLLAVLWLMFIIISSTFPDNIEVDKKTMNYTVVINVGIWILALIYYFVYGYKVYSGPKSNLDEPEYSDGSSVAIMDEVLSEKV